MQGKRLPGEFYHLMACLNPSEEMLLHNTIEEYEEAALNFIDKNPHLLTLSMPEMENITPLMAAVMQPNQCCSLNLFKRLISPPTNVNAVKDFGTTALHFLAMNNRVEHIKILLKDENNKINVNAKTTTQGLTPVYAAILNNALNALTLLIVLGKADVNICNTKKQSPLHVACRFGQSEEGKQNEKISEEEALKYEASIRLLLKSGANVNARCESGSTPVMYLAGADIPSKIKNSVLKQLIEYGAELSVKANDHFDVVSISKEYQFLEFSKKAEKKRVSPLFQLCVKKVLEIHPNESEYFISDISDKMKKIKLGNSKVSN